MNDEDKMVWICCTENNFKVIDMYIHSLEFNQRPEIENIVVTVDDFEYWYEIQEVNDVYYYVTV